ncbi:unnamed protein product, partial [Mesorhabditis spiculigera]
MSCRRRRGYCVVRRYFGFGTHRHFPNKYAMFRHAALELTDALESALDAVSVAADATTGSASRGFARCDPNDGSCCQSPSCTASFTLRTAGDTRAETILTSAMFSVIGSITAHNLILPQRRMEQVLLDACLSIEHGGECNYIAAVGANCVDAYRRDRSRCGFERFRDVPLLSEQSRNFSGGVLSSGRPSGPRDGSVFESATSPEEALRALSAMYVELVMNNLLPGHRSDLKNRQKLYVVEWARILREIRPDLSAIEAKFWFTLL